MSILQRVASVRAAQRRMHTASRAVSVPAAALLARVHRHPLSTLGVAGGAGFLLGRLNMHPLRIPGVSALFGGGLAEAIAYGTRLLAELGPAAFGAAAEREDRRASEHSDSAPPAPAAGTHDAVL